MQVSFHTQGLTLGRRLHGDLVAEIPLTRSGNSCSPDQVLLPVVEVCDSVEQQPWIGFILAGELRRTTKKEVRNVFFFPIQSKCSLLIIPQLILYVVMLEYANLALRSHYYPADLQNLTR